MDQTTPTSMDNNKKLVVRPAQQSTRPYVQDHGKDVSKRGGGGRRQQREWDRESVVIGGRSKAAGNGATGAGGGRGGGGRTTNRGTRNREKESGQVGFDCDWPLDHGDEEDLSCYSYQQQRGGARNQRNITHTLQSWWGGGGPNSRRGRGGGGGGRGKRKQYHGAAVTKMRNSKERFLQARCQFVVNPSKEAKARALASIPVGCAPSPPPPPVVPVVPPVKGRGAASQPSAADVSHNKATTVSACDKPPSSSTPLPSETGRCKASMEDCDDPDVLVSWGAVEEVLLHMTQPTNCPVCLYPPVAPQVTRCGHIYCYACILHYLALSDKKWRTCPICYEMVVRDDLKSAVCVVHPDYRVGSSIEMTLMKRDQHSMLPTPVSLSVTHHSTYARKTRATKGKMLSIIERERSALEMQMAAEGSQPEACFIEQALILVKEREGELQDYDEEEEEEGGGSIDSAQLVNVMHGLTLEDDDPQQNKEGMLRQEYTPIRVNKSQQNTSDLVVEGNKTATVSGKEANGMKRASNDQRKKDKSNKDNGKPNRHSNWNTGNPYNNSSFTRDIRSSSSSYSQFQFGSCDFNEIERTLDDKSDTVSVSSGELVLLEGEMVGELSDPDLDDTSEPNLLEHIDSNYSSEVDGNVSHVSNSECLHFDLEEELVVNKGTGAPSTVAPVACTSSSAIILPGGNLAPKSRYYFYQASDGSHVYLHALNVAMLTRQYGAEDRCPPSITATIVEKEYSLMDEDVRRRAKFLRHLPLCCPFETVELALQPPLVTLETIADFKSSLSRRQRQRATRAKAEHLIERRVQAQQDKELSSRLFTRVYSATSTSSRAQGSADRTPQSSVTDTALFPEMNASEGSAAGERYVTSSDGMSSPEFATSPPTHDNLGQQQLSFAKMVRVQPSSPRAVWPSLGQTPSTAAAGGGSWAHSSPRAAAWGNNPPHQIPATEEEGEDALFNAPDYKETFSQGFDVMLQQSITSATQSVKKGKKGKKKKQVLLFSSGGGF